MPVFRSGRFGLLTRDLGGIELQDLLAVAVVHHELVVIYCICFSILEISEVIRFLAHHADRGLAFVVRWDNRPPEPDPGLVSKLVI